MIIDFLPILAPIFHNFGSLWGTVWASWENIWAALSSQWSLLCPLWAHLWAILVPLGSLLATLWQILVPPGSFWTPPSLILEPLGTNFGAQWGVFWGVFWAYSFPRIPALLVAKYPGELVRLLGGPKTIHHLAGVKKLQTINENLSSRKDQKGSKQTYLRSMQPSSQTVI